ncbi:MAG: hypothetical protein J6128_05300 [Clostridia bacterium]|nr:hypothetical protein [Clostridia bacterium]
MMITVINECTGSVSGFAAEELCRFLPMTGDTALSAGKKTGAENGPRIILRADHGLEDYAYEAVPFPEGIVLQGKTEGECLLAVYRFLENAGIVFDARGAHLSMDAPGTAAALKEGFRTEPFVRLRGIRQHINFPMDISSYTPDDAKEYIRNLARMRMNALTFHSYGGFWHDGPGHFFYGKTFPVPDDPRIKSRIDNERIFVSPGCEKIWGDEKSVADYAVGFLRELIRTAKTSGMRVTLSIEPTENLKAVSDALRYYPEIDELEIISPELGVFGDAEETYSQVFERAVELFGEKILDGSGLIPGLDPGLPVPPKIWDTINALAQAIKIYENRERLFPEGQEKPIRIGLYVLCRGSLYITKRIMDKCLPESMTRTYLPAHGTEAVVDTLKYMKFEPEDFQKTAVHSWIEFDGNMYIQQNSAYAIEHTVDYLAGFTGAKSVCGLYFNHWRTSENLIPISYAAAAAESRISLKDFCVRYAGSFGLECGKFAETVARAGRFDTYCRDKLFNIGFCFLDCWTMHRGIGWTDLWKIESVLYAVGEAEKLGLCFSDLAESAQTDAGREVCDVCCNRYGAMICHLKLILSILKIRDICGKDNSGLGEDQKQGIRSALDEAKVHFDEYIDAYASLMPDRGCQGLIVDYYKTMLSYIDYLSRYYLGEATVSDGLNDSSPYCPPPPASGSAEESSYAPPPPASGSAVGTGAEK